MFSAIPPWLAVVDKCPLSSLRSGVEGGQGVAAGEGVYKGFVTATQFFDLLAALGGVDVVFYVLVVGERQTNGFLPWMFSCGFKSKIVERKLAIDGATFIGIDLLTTGSLLAYRTLLVATYYLSSSLVATLYVEVLLS
jgi:hypothetical protein